MVMKNFLFFLIILFLLLTILYFTVGKEDSNKKNEVEINKNKIEGPIGEPYVKGPTSPPPNMNK